MEKSKSSFVPSLFEISVNGHVIALCPFGSLEHFVSCVLHACSSVSISLVVDSDFPILNHNVKDTLCNKV